jgi:hypothetical protein
MSACATVPSIGSAPRVARPAALALALPPPTTHVAAAAPPLFGFFAAAAVALGAPADALAAAAPAPAAPPTPYERGLRLEYGLLPDGRIRSCDAGAQPNCVSTSSLANQALYAQPWLASQAEPAAAFAVLDAALNALLPAVEPLARETRPDGAIYGRWRVPSPFVYDVVEVLVARQRAPYEAEPPMATFRSQCATSKYVWPVTQAITDGGANRKRMAALRELLGWRIQGGDCSSLECYQ